MRLVQVRKNSPRPWRPFCWRWRRPRCHGGALAETMLRIGMTAADIPRTLGQPDQGFEGNRFTGLTMYDALDDVGPVFRREGRAS